MKHPRGFTEINLLCDAAIHELRNNGFKGDWTRLKRKDVFAEIDYHVAKLKAATRAGEPTRVLEFAADVVNEVMFLAANEGVLTDAMLYKRRHEPPYTGWSHGFARRMLRYPRWWKAVWHHFRTPDVPAVAGKPWAGTAEY